VGVLAHEKAHGIKRHPTAGEYEFRKTISLAGRDLLYHYVDVANPHAVIFLDENSELPDNLLDTPVEEVGRAFQAHSRFTPTCGINVEFVHELPPDKYEMRVFERSVGETSSCGTGSIAVVRAAYELGRPAGDWVNVSQPGYRLHEPLYFRSF